MRQLQQDAIPLPIDYNWLEESLAEIDIFVERRLATAEETLERVCRRTHVQIELQENHLDEIQERIRTLREAQNVTVEYIQLLRAPESSSDFEATYAHRARLVDLVRRILPNEQIPTPGPDELRMWDQILQRIGWARDNEHKDVERWTHTNNTLQEQYATYMHLLERSRTLAAQPRQLHVAPLSLTSYTSRGATRPKGYTNEKAVLEAIEAAGPGGATMKQILSFLHSINHHLATRKDPNKAVGNEIHDIRREYPGLIETERSGREAIYILKPDYSGIQTADHADERAAAVPPATAISALPAPPSGPAKKTSTRKTSAKKTPTRRKTRA
jgi:hypothetical protein